MGILAAADVVVHIAECVAALCLMASWAVGEITARDSFTRIERSSFVLPRVENNKVMGVADQDSPEDPSREHPIAR
jgi:hypothetical protein